MRGCVPWPSVIGSTRAKSGAMKNFREYAEGIRSVFHASSVKTPSAPILGDFFVSHGGIDVLDPTPADHGTTMRDTSCPVEIRSRHFGHDPERPDPMGPVSGTSHEPDLRGESVVVVKAAEHRASHELDRAFPTRGRGRPRQAGAVLRYAFDSLMRPTFVVVGDVRRDGAAKVVFRRR